MPIKCSIFKEQSHYDHVYNYREEEEKSQE